MKILQVITSLQMGGAEKLVVEMMPLLREKGHLVDILLFNGIETTLKKKLKKDGFNVYEFSINGFIYNPCYIFKLISFIKNYDVIHSHNAACQYFVALAKLFSFTKIKLVTTEHSTNNRRRNMYWINIVEKLIYSQYDAIVAITKLAANLLKQHLCKEDGIITIPNGVNISQFQNAIALDRKDLALPDSVILITMVAGFRDAKDQDTLIRALALLTKNYFLCLVGDGVRRSTCEKLAKDINVYDRVVFTGIRDDIPQLLKSSDIVVMSSHWEGLSLSNIEGMSVGKPFIASDVNGLREITEGAGIMFPKGDAKKLAWEIDNLMNDKTYYNKIAQQCQKRAAEFDITNTVEAYENIYINLIKRI